MRIRPSGSVNYAARRVKRRHKVPREHLRSLRDEPAPETRRPAATTATHVVTFSKLVQPCEVLFRGGKSKHWFGRGRRKKKQKQRRRRSETVPGGEGLSAAFSLRATTRQRGGTESVCPLVTWLQSLRWGQPSTQQQQQRRQPHVSCCCRSQRLHSTQTAFPLKQQVEMLFLAFIQRPAVWHASCWLKHCCKSYWNTCFRAAEQCQVNFALGCWAPCLNTNVKCQSLFSFRSSRFW